MTKLYEVYNINKSYAWNYENAPCYNGEKPIRPKTKVENKINLFGFDLRSPLGVPAGPLLNSNWVKFYAEMGFDIPVYKTVRTVERECLPVPNCVYVDSSRQLSEGDRGAHIYTSEGEPRTVDEISITNSFGMPSMSPDVWMEDIEVANSYMQDGQIMVVSVVGTPEESNPTPAALAKDYARCAAMAKEAGAKIIEANYSCPNVASAEGAIFQSAELSNLISKEIRAAIGSDMPFMIKAGYFKDEANMKEVLAANAGIINGIAGINTISMSVSKSNGSQALPGRDTSGICGSIIRDMGLEFIGNVRQTIEAEKYDMTLCGVGGIVKPEDVDSFINVGADIVMSATGAMWHPNLANEYHVLKNQ
ncbi:MAG: dihydroorotate dehydrogenase [Alphaproteobacteria bacterium]|nr:dihydroorotate dehydrogenase [Alphaproteobacteria bacterium]